jgi:hypothetical protein
MARLLVAAAFAWPMLLGAAVWARHGDQPRWTRMLYAAAGQVCHQRPDRSFFTAGVQWPVCSRCSGLYLAAPFGTLLALRRRRVPGPEGPGLQPSRGALGLQPSPIPARILLIAAAPTLLTLGIEWPHLAPVSNLARATTAVPLGCAIAWVLVRVTAGPPETNRVH